MNSSERFEMKMKLSEITRCSEGLVPPETTEDAREFVYHGEYAVALEILCDQLYEYDAQVRSDLYTKIREAGEQLSVRSDYWETLRDSIVE